MTGPFGCLFGLLFAFLAFLLIMVLNIARRVRNIMSSFSPKNNSLHPVIHTDKPRRKIILNPRPTVRTKYSTTTKGNMWTTRKSNKRNLTFPLKEVFQQSHGLVRHHATHHFRSRMYGLRCKHPVSSFFIRCPVDQAFHLCPSDGPRTHHTRFQGYVKRTFVQILSA